MNIRVLGTGLAILLSFIVGRYVLPDPESGFTGIPSDSGDSRHARNDGARGGDGFTPSKLKRNESGELELSSELVPSAIYHALHTGDPIDLQLQVYELLKKMDRSNWKEVHEQFALITARTGRTHDEFWEPMLIRMGQVGGEEAIKHFQEMGPVPDRMVYGWAMQEPEEVMDWLERNADEDPAMVRSVTPLLAGGLALKDPALAKDFLDSLPEDAQANCAGHLVWNLVRGQGVEGASGLLDEVLAQDSSSELAKRVFDEVAEAASRTGVGPEGVAPVLEWYERYGESPYLTTDHIASAARQFRADLAVRGLDFLMGVSDLPVMAGSSASPPQLTNIIREAYQVDAEGLESWLEQHRGAPFRDRAISDYVELLESEGESDKAAHWRSELSP